MVGEIGWMALKIAAVKSIIEVKGKLSGMLKNVLSFILRFPAPISRTAAVFNGFILVCLNEVVPCFACELTMNFALIDGRPLDTLFEVTKRRCS